MSNQPLPTPAAKEAAYRAPLLTTGAAKTPGCSDNAVATLSWPAPALRSVSLVAIYTSQRLHMRRWQQNTGHVGNTVASVRHTCVANEPSSVAPSSNVSPHFALHSLAPSATVLCQTCCLLLRHFRRLALRVSPGSALMAVTAVDDNVSPTGASQDS